MQLKENEIQILILYALGYASRAIGKKLNLSPAVVQTRIKKCINRIGAVNITNAVFLTHEYIKGKIITNATMVE